MTLRTRLRKLEAHGADEIAIYCDELSEVPSTVDQMIADGEILEVDRPRCVHWLSVTKCVPGTHERRLEQLDADEAQSENETSQPGGRPGAGDLRTSGAAAVVKIGRRRL